MKRPRILLDVDGPLTDGFWHEACVVLRDFGIDARVELIDRWDVFEAFRASPEITAAARRRLRRPGLARDLTPHPGAREFVAELQTWADVYAVTAPLDDSPTWAYERETWLEQVVGIPRDRVVSCRDKTVVSGDVLIDDRVSTVKAWSAAHPEGLGILWRAPHNAAESWSLSVGTYDGLREFLGGLL